MNAITLWQPWAQLTVLGLKINETRSWPTKIRGTIAMHAAKRVTDGFEYREPFWTALVPYFIEETGPLPLGAIVGTIEIVDCLKVISNTGKSAVLEDDTVVDRNEFMFGDYTPGRYAWRLQNPILFRKPVPAIGSQGFWKWVA